VTTTLTTLLFVRWLGLNNIASEDNLSRIKVNMGNLYVMCGIIKETWSHLFLNCQIVSMVSNACNRVHPNNIKMHLLQHNLMCFSKKEITTWETMRVACNMWYQRNEVISKYGCLMLKRCLQ